MKDSHNNEVILGQGKFDVFKMMSRGLCNDRKSNTQLLFLESSNWKEMWTWLCHWNITATHFNAFVVRDFIIIIWVGFYDIKGDNILISKDVTWVIGNLE